MPQVCPPAQQRQLGSPAKQAQPKGGSSPKQHGAGPAAAASGGLSPKGLATAPWVKPQPAAAADKGAGQYDIFLLGSLVATAGHGLFAALYRAAAAHEAAHRLAALGPVGCNSEQFVCTARADTAIMQGMAGWGRRWRTALQSSQSWRTRRRCGGAPRRSWRSMPPRCAASPANSFVPSIHDMLTLTAAAIDKDPLLRSLVRRVVIADAMPVREPPCSLSSC